MNTFHQAFLSGSLGGVTVTFYLLICRILDRYMRPRLSNMIGLCIDAVLSYTLQQLIFYGSIRLCGQLFQRFMIGNSLSVLVSQLVFSYGLPYYNRYIDKYPRFKNSSYRLTLWRYLTNIVVYLVITFPLRKYYIFQ